jgi:ATP-dependent DNA ligase
VKREKMAACIWVAPRLRAEVEFLNWTKSGNLRHASFRRLLPEVGERSVA